MEENFRNLENFSQNIVEFGQNTRRAINSLQNISEQIPNQIRDALVHENINFQLEQFELRINTQIQNLATNLTNLGTNLTNLSTNITNLATIMTNRFDEINSNLTKSENRNIVRTINSKANRLENQIFLFEVDGEDIPFQIQRVRDLKNLEPDEVIQILTLYDQAIMNNDQLNRIKLANFLGINSDLVV